MTRLSGGVGVLICLFITSALPGAEPATMPDDAPTTAPAAAQPVAAQPGPARTGAMHTVFTRQDPRSTLTAQHARHHIEETDLQRYTLADESFEVFVPPDLDPAQPPGILVFVNSGNSGRPPAGWTDLAKSRRLIYVGANNSGNERGLAVRFGLAIDAVFNLSNIYPIDTARVYVSGVSGGGKVASMLGVLYPEIFGGSIPIVGTSYFKPIPLSTDTTHYFPANYARPTLEMYDRARQEGRFVLVTGSEDMNRDSIRDMYNEGFVADHFSFVKYVEIPGMGHGLPKVDVIDDAINVMDSPLPQLARKWFDWAQVRDRASKYAEALPMYRQAQWHLEGPSAAVARSRVLTLSALVGPMAPAAPRQPTSSPSATTAPSSSEDASNAADSIYSLAENYRRSGMVDQARQRYEKIIHDYPQTIAARHAKDQLAKLK